MADFMRAIITAWDSADPEPGNRIANTVYFRANAFDPNSPTLNWQTLANDINAAFVAGSTVYYAGLNTAQTRIYDIEDGVSGPPKATSPATTFTKRDAGPREVALCLSYRAAANGPRTRGRLYMGPFGSTQMDARPLPALRTSLRDLGSRLGGIGGVNIDWCVFSPTQRTADAGANDNAFKPVAYTWVDDAWDTVRSRGLPPSARTAGAQES